MSKRNVRPFHDLSFASKVAAARPTAASILMRVFDGDTDVPIIEDLAKLIGDRDLEHCDPGVSAAEFTRLNQRLTGALALGVAVGLSLRGESFTAGGVR